MKKDLCLLLLAGAMFFSSCNKLNENKQAKYIEYKENIETVDSKKDSINKNGHIYIKRMLSNIERTNNEYLHRNFKKINFFKEEESLKYVIINFLNEKDHSPRLKNAMCSEDYYQINELSLKQNKVIYLMLKSLEDSSFSNQIGRIIKEDVEDKYSEHGGIITFKEEGNINLVCLESELAEQNDKANDNQYAIPLGAFFTRKIADFHLHAGQYDETPFTGPSEGDIFCVEEISEVFGLTNEFIITSIKKGKFNIDYLGIDTAKSSCAKTIDLGNYSYDTIKIER